MSIPVPGKLAESVRQSVVQVQSDGGSAGSGVVIAAGLVVTNAHVVAGAKTLLETWEGARLQATLVKANRTRDLALLSAPDLKSPSMPLGDSTNLPAGTPVFAVGNPLGFVGAVSSGVIRDMNLRRWICADVRLAPGNSGGPLANFNGQLVAINTMVVNGGLALAVPSRDVQRFLKHQDSANLGVTVRGVKFRAGSGERFGILVTGIDPASPAERASLLPGDIITGANGQTFSHADDLTDAIDSAPNGLLHLEFYRGDGRTARLVTVAIAEQRARAAA